MRFAAALLALSSLTIVAPSQAARERGRTKSCGKISPLPVALSNDFEFRKTKLFFLSDKPPKPRQGGGAGRRSSTLGGKVEFPRRRKRRQSQDAPSPLSAQYRLFGAVTALDQRQRFGSYLDFYWRAKRPSDVTVRLEYRQEKLHEHVQAQEISYRNVRGTHEDRIQSHWRRLFGRWSCNCMAVSVNRKRSDRSGESLLHVGVEIQRRVSYLR